MLPGYVPLPSGNLVLEVGEDAIGVPVGSIFVGRSEGCFLCVDDPGVSRVHLRIDFDVDEGAFISDLGSRNGTLINGEMLRGRRRLADGDIVALGARMFIVRIVAREVDPDSEEQTAVQVQPFASTMPAVDAGLPTADDHSASQPSGSGTLLGISAATLEPTCPSCGFGALPASGVCPICNELPDRLSPRKPTQRHNSFADVGREHPRYPVEIPVRYRSANLELAGLALNISRSGLFIGTRELDELGMACELVLDDDERLTTKAIVRHLLFKGARNPRRSGMGVEFTEVSEDCADWLEQLLARAGASEGET